MGCGVVRPVVAHMRNTFVFCLSPHVSDWGTAPPTLCEVWSVAQSANHLPGGCDGRA